MQAFILKLSTVLCLIFALSSATAAQTTQSLNLTTSGQPEVYFVTDVAAQFNQLALRPDPIGFTLSPTAPEPRLGKHFQGIVRRHGPGVPYMFLSRSGNDVPECVGCNDDPGNIFVVRMQSRDTNGERMRSNRLRRNWSIAGTIWPGVPNFWTTPPDILDQNFRTIHFDGHDGWPNYAHPGGMQVVGDVLIVPLSRPYNQGDPKNLFLFIDISNPEFPSPLSTFDPLSVSDPSSEFGVGELAVAPVKNPLGPGVRYILLVAGESNRDVRLYRSKPTSEDGSTNLKDLNLKWEFIKSWSRDTVTDTGPDAWPCCGSQSHQMFNFVRQESLDGPLFLIGARNDSSVIEPFGGTDFLHLYKVNIDQFGNPGDRLLTHIERKHVSSDSTGGGGDTSHFTGSTGVYVSPSGELIVYASEHANYGPPQELLGRQTVRFGEYRHREMVRPGSPTMKPGIVPTGTFEVDEGSTTLLFSQGRPAITKAWMQFFEDDGIGLDDEFDGNEWLPVDWQDTDKDNYDDFTKLFFNFNDNAGSWRWFAPTGCNIDVYQHTFDDDDFPGYRKTLHGTGAVEEAGDLDQVMDDSNSVSMNDMISSLQFKSCDTYYNAPLSVSWDLDQNGSYEKPGNLVTFSAEELDGRPTLLAIPVRAQHPTDTSPLGTSAPATVSVRVKNVAPLIGTLDLLDPVGFKVGVDVPFAIANLQYTSTGTFTDPGKPDTQTAMLDMGDGTITDNTKFVLFTDAFGGRTGEFKQHHRYRASGTYTITLEVKDDDGGTTTATKSVTVVTAAEVIGSVIAEIDKLLATATNRTVIRALRDARDNLKGHNDGAAHDGALDALASRDLVAALEKISAATDALQKAEAAGAGDLNNLKYLLALAGESVAQGAYQDAVDAITTPSPGQTAQLDRIRQLITDGHNLVMSKDYLGGIALFKDAAGRALSLL